MIGLLLIFFLVRGMVRIQSGRSGINIVRFNAFGNHRETKIMSKPNDRTDDHSRILCLTEPFDEGAVYFERVELKLMQVAQA